MKKSRLTTRAQQLETSLGDSMITIVIIMMMWSPFVPTYFHGPNPPTPWSSQCHGQHDHHNAMIIAMPRSSQYHDHHNAMIITMPWSTWSWQCHGHHNAIINMIITMPWSLQCHDHHNTMIITMLGERTKSKSGRGFGKQWERNMLSRDVLSHKIDLAVVK